MDNRRYIELRILEAIEYIKYSKEASCSFIIRVGDKKNYFAFDYFNPDIDNTEKNTIIDRFLDVLHSMEFRLDEQHIIELINDLKKVKLFKYINECINHLEHHNNNSKIISKSSMKNFTIQPNGFLRSSIQAFYHQDYTTFGAPSNPDFINHLKNQFGNTNVNTLQQSINEFVKILKEDLHQIKNLRDKTNLTVCVIPRAKAENSYLPNQKLFKKVISLVVDELLGFSNGTDYIIRHTNTRTTHMNTPRANAALENKGTPNDGDLPYPGITAKTCNVSNDVKGKDILLIDDIYTKTINIDEDCIQALLDKGANSVIFYAVGKTVDKIIY